jgi:hypothetical protein
MFVFRKGAKKFFVATFTDGADNAASKCGLTLCDVPFLAAVFLEVVSLLGFSCLGAGIQDIFKPI